MVATTRVTCDHLGAVVGSRGTEFGQEPAYQCGHPDRKEVREVECVTCELFYQQHSQGDGCRHPHGVIVDRYNRSAGLADLYYGASAFLHLGGPSVKSLDLTQLNRRGVLLLSVNNCPASLPEGVRPHVWLHTDPSGKFHDSIWRDPGVIKIVPVKEWKSRWSNNSKGRKKGIKHKVDGRLVPIEGITGHDMPGVLGFHRTTTFAPDTFLWEPEMDRGNDEKSATGIKNGKKVGEPNGWPHTINTMFCALRMAFYLGVRELYLVGADFTMRPDQPYGFDQGKTSGGCKSNNSAYTDMNQMLDGLKEKFLEADYHIYNTGANSRLWTFPTVPFDEAIERVTGSFEQTLDAKGWYDD